MVVVAWTITSAAVVVAIASLAITQHTHKHMFSSFDMEFAYLRGYADCLFNRECDPEKVVSDEEAGV